MLCPLPHGAPACLLLLLLLLLHFLSCHIARPVVMTSATSHLHHALLNIADRQECLYSEAANKMGRCQAAE